MIIVVCNYATLALWCVAIAVPSYHASINRLHVHLSFMLFRSFILSRYSCLHHLATSVTCTDLLFEMITVKYNDSFL